MTATVPASIVEPFALNGLRNTIPVPTQIPITPGRASYNDGFPPLTMTDVLVGGIPPAGRDFNGILYSISSHAAWQSGGGGYSFDSTWSAANGGYSAGFTLRSATNPGQAWTSKVNANTTNPDVDPTTWAPCSLYYARTAREISAGATPTAYYYVPGDARRYGATGDGSDQTTVLQNWVACGELDLYLPQGTYALTGALVPVSGSTITGAGKSTVLSQSGSTPGNIWYMNASQTNITIQGMKLTPQSTGANRGAVWINTGSSAITLRDLVIEGQTDSVGIYAFNASGCLADNIYFDGGASRNGYLVYIGGCSGFKITNSTAYRPSFGFVIVGQDIEARANNDGFGNIVDCCTCHGMDGHAFDINSSNGNVISNCTAYDYAGASTNPAFQLKGEIANQNCQNNIVTGCTAWNVPTGFNTQLGLRNVFTGCTSRTTSQYGMYINNSPELVVDGCVFEDFTIAGIAILSSSANGSFNSIMLTTTTATAVGISFNVAGASNNSVDNVRMPCALAAAIVIAAGAANNRFGSNVYIQENAITDLSGTTIWPVRMTTPEITAGSTGNVNGAYAHRGMVVAIARFVITASLTGTPQVQCGRLGSNAEIAAAQNVTGSAGAAVTLTQATQLLSTGAIMQGRVSTAGGGTGFFQYEGLPRL